MDWDGDTGVRKDRVLYGRAVGKGGGRQVTEWQGSEQELGSSQG